MDKIRDLNDGKERSEVDLRDLRASIERGDTIEMTAILLCRTTNVVEVEAKARELGLPARHD
jgi:hypothetical protein